MSNGMMDCMMNGMMNSGMMNGGMMNGMMNGGILGGGVMVLWGLLTFGLLIGLIAAVALGVIWMVRQVSGSTGVRPQSTETPLEILQRRLAQGEITLEQFETMKYQLQAG